VIPRYHGDVAAPRSGGRHVIPEKADYAGMVREAQSAPYDVLTPTAPGGHPAPTTVRPPHWHALVRGGNDPLLPHLRVHLATAIRVDMAVAFILERGLAAIDEYLQAVVQRGGRLWARRTSCSRRGPSTSSTGWPCAKSAASGVKLPDVIRMPPAARLAVTSPSSSRAS
jgi:hypothetical protein